MRVRMFAAAAALAIAAPLNAQPYGMGDPGYWIYASRADAKPGGLLTGSHSTYVHVVSRDAASGKVIAETATVFDQEQTSHPSGHYWQLKAETVFDCRARSYRFVRITFYNKPATPGAKADLLWSDAFPPAQQEEKPVRPETTAGDAMKIACG